MIRALLSILLLLAAAAAGAASAEDLNPTARAKAAGNAAKIGSGSSVFTTGKIEGDGDALRRHRPAGGVDPGLEPRKPRARGGDLGRRKLQGLSEDAKQLAAPADL